MMPLSSSSFPTGLSGLAALPNAKIHGLVGDCLTRCYRNHIAGSDPLVLSGYFHNRQQSWTWQSEFWGKWMHSAVPLALYFGDECFKQRIADSVRDLLSTQDADGYIGNCKPELRYAKGTWDVWGTKYTLLGLLHWFDATHDENALTAAQRLADGLIRHFQDRDIAQSGWYLGLPSCSVLEPIVLLFKITKEPRYLAFAGQIRNAVDADTSARLVRDADVPVFLRKTMGGLDSSLKAYEMMSCYQGLLELHDVTGEDALLRAAETAATHIWKEEINLAGGAAAGEHWYGGSEKQHLPYNRLNETCVLTTWLRLCRKLWEKTRAPVWLDAFERTFFNAYLAAMKPDGSCFAQYTPLEGTRAPGEHHCHTETNCCNANGPRGFVEFLKLAADASGSTVWLNLFSSGNWKLPLCRENGTRSEVRLEVYTDYPRRGEILIWNRTPEPCEFHLVPHIPGWCENATIRLNGEPCDQSDLNRLWKPGDQLSILLDMPVKPIVQNDSIAFVRGPILLARDARFGGQVGEPVRRNFYSDGSGETEIPDVEKTKFPFHVVRSDAADVWLRLVGILPTGVHAESVRDGWPEAVGFCDFASAGNTWDSRSAYRVWLPLVRFESRR